MLPCVSMWAYCLIYFLAAIQSPKLACATTNRCFLPCPEQPWLQARFPWKPWRPRRSQQPRSQSPNLWPSGIWLCTAQPRIAQAGYFAGKSPGMPLARCVGSHGWRVSRGEGPCSGRTFPKTKCARRQSWPRRSRPHSPSQPWRLSRPWKLWRPWRPWRASKPWKLWRPWRPWKPWRPWRPRCQWPRRSEGPMYYSQCHSMAHLGFAKPRLYHGCSNRTVARSLPDFGNTHCEWKNALLLVRFQQVFTVLFSISLCGFTYPCVVFPKPLGFPCVFFNSCHFLFAFM